MLYRQNLLARLDGTEFPGTALLEKSYGVSAPIAETP
jgi:hypothetical protein